MSVQVPEQIESNSNVPPRWFWVVSGVALAWNLIGVAAFLGQMTMDTSSLSNVERAFHESTPVWATIAFGVAVSAGVLGSIVLLLRRRLAISTFIVSFFGIVIQDVHSILIGDGIEVFGAAGRVLSYLTLSIAAALIGYARYSSTKGWIA